MLKINLSNEEFENLTDGFKEHYKLDVNSGKYKLDLGPDVFTTDKDPGALLRAVDHEKERFKKANETAEEYEKKYKELENWKKEQERSGIKDIDELKESFKQDLEDMKNAYEEKERKNKEILEKQKEIAANQLLEKTALEYSQKIFSDNAGVMLPHVKSRMKLSLGELTDAPKIEFLSEDGITNIPEQNFQAFEKSLLTNESFARMKVVSKASGASGSGEGKTAVDTSHADGSKKVYSDYKPGELKRLKETDPELFKELFTNR